VGVGLEQPKAKLKMCEHAHKEGRGFGGNKEIPNQNSKFLSMRSSSESESESDSDGDANYQLPVAHQDPQPWNRWKGVEKSSEVTLEEGDGRKKKLKKKKMCRTSGDKGKKLKETGTSAHGNTPRGASNARDVMLNRRLEPTKPKNYSSSSDEEEGSRQDKGKQKSAFRQILCKKDKSGPSPNTPAPTRKANELECPETIVKATSLASVPPTSTQESLAKDPQLTETFKVELEPQIQKRKDEFIERRHPASPMESTTAMDTPEVGIFSIRHILAPRHKLLRLKGSLNLIENSNRCGQHKFKESGIPKIKDNLC